jgi:hypothetical protein
VRTQSAVTLLAWWLGAIVPGSPAFAEPANTAAGRALRFFDSLPRQNARETLRALRPPPASPPLRARALAALPRDGILVPNDSERSKLTGLEAVLVYHERLQVFDVRVVDLPIAAVALYYRSVLLISRPALRLLSAAELQAIVAHEIGHEYFWSEFEITRAGQSHLRRQELELKCDGVAVLTLTALGLNPARLVESIRKVDRFNAFLGPAADADAYPSARDRIGFVKVLLKSIAHRGASTHR